MKNSAKSISSIITLRREAVEKLEKVLSMPTTPQELSSFKQSIGTYSYYQTKWQKRK